MGLWIKDSELEVFRIDGIDARFYLKRISRGAMLKAEEINSKGSLDTLPAHMLKPSPEQRQLAAEQRAEHDAKPLEERLEAERELAYERHDRKTVLDFGLIRVEEGNGDGPKITEGVDWIETLVPDVCEVVFRALIDRNAILPSRLKG